MTREFKYINGTLKFIDCEIWTTNIKFQKYLQIKNKREKKVLPGKNWNGSRLVN